MFREIALALMLATTPPPTSPACPSNPTCAGNDALLPWPLSRVPDLVWSGLAASLVTFFGVVLANRHNSKRHRDQLHHDAHQKSLDRLDELRRDTYLEAVEGWTSANAHLSRLPVIDISKVDPADGVQSLSKSLNKIQLVSEDATARLAIDLQVAYGVLFLALSKCAIPIQQAGAKAKAYKNISDSSRADVQRALDEMRQLNESGRRDDTRFAALSRSIEASNELAKQNSEKWAQFDGQFAQGLRAYFADFIEKIGAIQPKMRALLIALCAETNVSTDLAKFEKSHERAHQVMVAEMRDYLQFLEQQANR